MRKAIVLAGGYGTRLSPITKCTMKQFLPVYDKPMIYYPLTLLVESGFSDILVITRPDTYDTLSMLLSDFDGSGVRFTVTTQAKPDGIPNALTIADEVGFFDDYTEPVALMLGDNLFHSETIKTYIAKACLTAHTAKYNHATIFPVVSDKGHQYGVIRFRENAEDATQEYVLIEKPGDAAEQELVIPGLYLFSSPEVVKRVRKLKPSGRNELEIVDLLQTYLSNWTLRVETLPLGTAWFDCGNPDELLDASQYVRAIQSRQGVQIGNLHVAVYTHPGTPENYDFSSNGSLGNTKYEQYTRRTCQTFPYTDTLSTI